MPAIGIMLGLANAGQGGAYNPALLTSLATWHDTADATQVTLNGADISSIADKSGNSRTASQGVAGEQPLYGVDGSGINGKGVIAFTGANNDALSLANSLGLIRNVPGFTIAGVVRITTLGTLQRVFTALTSGGGVMFNLGVGTSGVITAGTRRVGADTLSNLSSVAALTAGQAYFVAASVNYSTGKVILVIDGTAREQTASWTVGANSEDVNHQSAPLFGRQSTNVITGALAEPITCRVGMTAAEIADLRGRYYQGKWGTA